MSADDDLAFLRAYDELPLNAAPPHTIDRMESLPILHAEMDAFSERYAELWASYGPGGTWEHERKQRLADASSVARHALIDQGKSFTEAMLEEQARVNLTYKQYLDTVKRERKEYQLLHMKMEKLKNRIRRSDALQYQSNREARLPQ